MLALGSHEADDSPYPRRHNRDRRKSNGPCRYTAFEPLCRKRGMDPLRGYEDEGRDDADHDGREQGTENDRCKTGGNTHLIFLGVVAKLENGCYLDSSSN